LGSKPFLAVRHSIAFVEEHASEFLDPGDINLRAVALAVLVAHGRRRTAASEGASAVCSPWEVTDGFTPNLSAMVRYTLSRQGQRYGAELGFDRGFPSAVEVQLQTDARRPEGSRVEVRDVELKTGFASATLAGVRISAHHFVDGEHVHLWLDVHHYEFLFEDQRSIQFSSTAAEGGLTTPLPGVVVAVRVEPGQVVAPGEALMVIEAMKMEHTIAAPYAGTVKAIHFACGQRVPEGSKLLEIAPSGG
jgi:3-methylcrotonyl-CoA carboxylase alpha subunit